MPSGTNLASSSHRVPTPEEPEPPSPDPLAERWKRLVALARGKKHALVLTHDNPDPDSIASAVGLGFLLEELARVPARVAYGGIVGRAENRALVRVLRLPLTPVSRIEFRDYDFVALVDTQPDCGNHSLLARAPLDVVIDHHPARAGSDAVAFAQVGGGYGATASVVTGYLRAAGVELPRSVATALFYGIKSDTRDLGREFGPIDVDNYRWLFPRVDHLALSQIEHPSLPTSYFAAFHRALGKAMRYGEAVVADLGDVYAPDIVAEVAERLVSLVDMRWSLALGAYEGHLYFSVRTNDRRMNAGRLVQQIVDEDGEGGSAGGHGSMAGGWVPLPEGDAHAVGRFRRKLVQEFLREFGAPVQGEKLV